MIKLKRSFLNKQIDQLDGYKDLSKRAQHTLQLLRVVTVWDLVGLTEEDFEPIPNCGDRTLRKIRTWMAENDLYFGIQFETDEG